MESSLVRVIPIHFFLVMLSACGGGEEGAGGVAGGPSGAAGSSCSSLEGRSLGGARITNAVEAAVGGTPACVVAGRVDPAILFELTIPCDWNGKLLYLGTGGFGGSIPKPTTAPSPGVLGDATCDGRGAGYAVVASDTGHSSAGGFEASWVLSSPEVVDDFGYRAVHVVQQAAREIVRTRTGQAVTRAYFEGCSNGGREGLMSAQRYPADFDGIIARAPVVNLTGLMMSGNAIARRLAVAGARPGRRHHRATCLVRGRHRHTALSRRHRCNRLPDRCRDRHIQAGALADTSAVCAGERSDRLSGLSGRL
jgi:Tannase and feruloyl esterase